MRQPRVDALQCRVRISLIGAVADAPILEDAEDFFLGRGEHLAALKRLIIGVAKSRCWRESRPAASPCRGRCSRSTWRWPLSGPTAMTSARYKRSADGFEVAVLLEPLGEQREIDTHAVFVHRQQVLEQHLVGMTVEILCPQGDAQRRRRSSDRAGRCRARPFRPRCFAAAAGRESRSATAVRRGESQCASLPCGPILRAATGTGGQATSRRAMY